MSSPRVQTTLKTVLLIGLGLFLLSRIVTGTLYYYINERFMVLVVMGIVGLFLLGFGYWAGAGSRSQKAMITTTAMITATIMATITPRG